MDKNICSIICGAPVELKPRELVEGLVIAADSGLDRCLEAGIMPDVAVGDFDSANTTIPNGVRCERVSPEKDDTDAVLAAELAIKSGCRELRFFCVLGGRIDHSFANIQMLYNYKKRGINGVLFRDDAAVFFLRNESVRIPKGKKYLSVFSYEETAVITEAGVKYPTEGRRFSNNAPFGVSNEIIDDFAEITVHSGTALIMLVDEKDKFSGSVT